MISTWKCTQCAIGPCTYQAEHAVLADPAGYGEDCMLEPTTCPHEESEEEAVWRELRPEEPVSGDRCERLMEWLNGEGWDRFPEDLREELVCIKPASCQGVDMDRARRFFGVLCEYNRYGYSREEFQKELNKTTKLELVASILPQAFAAGIIWTVKKGLEKQTKTGSCGNE